MKSINNSFKNHVLCALLLIVSVPLCGMERSGDRKGKGKITLDSTTSEFLEKRASESEEVPGSGPRIHSAVGFMPIGIQDMGTRVTPVKDSRGASGSRSVPVVPVPLRIMPRRTEGFIVISGANSTAGGSSNQSRTSSRASTALRDLLNSSREQIQQLATNNQMAPVIVDQEISRINSIAAESRLVEYISSDEEVVLVGNPDEMEKALINNNINNIIKVPFDTVNPVTHPNIGSIDDGKYRTPDECGYPLVKQNWNRQLNVLDQETTTILVNPFLLEQLPAGPHVGSLEQAAGVYTQNEDHDSNRKRKLLGEGSTKKKMQEKNKIKNRLPRRCILFFSVR